MRARRTDTLVTLAATLILSACDAGPSDPSRPSEAAPGGGPQLSIEDAVHNAGNPHFFWLPPMVSAPNYGGTFDGGLAPVVRICEWTGASCGTVLAEFTTLTGPGSETVRVVAADQHYIVNWHTDQFGLDPAKTYRIVAEVDGQALGHADVDVVQNGSQLKNVQTNEYIPLVNGRTLPIKFRIEDGALGTDVTIDARALTSPNVDLWGPSGRIGYLPAAQPIVIPATPGSYSIADRFGGTPIPFSITAAGVVDYATQYDAIFSGRGSRTLGVLGHGFTVDGTQLSTLVIRFGGVGSFSNSGPIARVELPGAKDVQDGAGGVLFYNVTTAGTITYAAADEPIADGAGTTTLTLVGLAYTVDARALSAPNFLLTVIGTFPTATPKVVRGLPGLKSVQDVSGGVVDYQLTANGLIAYGALEDVVLDGQGTATLTVVGHTIQIDATQMSGSGFAIGAVGSFSSSVPATLVLLAGQKAFISANLSFTFTVDAAGHVDYASALDGQLAGRGTNTLTILP